MPQKIFNPADYCFEWTSPTAEDSMGWYKWNRMKPIGSHCEIAIRTLNYSARMATTQSASAYEINS